MNWAVLEQRSVSWLPSASQSTHETECDLGMYTWFSIHASSCSSCLRPYHPEQAQSHLNAQVMGHFSKETFLKTQSCFLDVSGFE